MMPVRSPFFDIGILNIVFRARNFDVWIMIIMSASGIAVPKYVSNMPAEPANGISNK